MDTRRRDAIFKALAFFEFWNGELNLMRMVMLLCLYVYTKKLRRSQNASRSRALTVPNRQANIDRILNEGDRNSQWDLRMDLNAFKVLCEMLQVHGGLRNTGHVPIEEKVLIFLRILAQNESNRVLQVRFMRSGETISRVFHSVLKAVLNLQHLLYVKPIPIPQDCTDSRWKWFKGCLGALDGTYIDITVPLADKPRYRGRKGRICTNVLGVCDKNLNFVYVLAGWEGSASDSRVLHDAVTRRNGLQVPMGNYYLVDAGYTNGPGFLAPYRGTRYHIQEWARDGRAPRTPEELFNKRHSSARNVIERAFGLLKIRWKILRNPSFYAAATHVHIILACCLLHNFIRLHMASDPAEQIPLEDEDLPIGEDVSLPQMVDRVAPTNEWSQWREDLAHNMFAEWRSNH